MSNVFARNILRWVIFMFIQVLVLKQVEVNFGWLNEMSLLFYPLFIILLPTRYSTISVMIIAFFTGLFVDVFYDSIGVHAAACVFLAFIRPLAFNIFSPREGYKVDLFPTVRNLGFPWFLRYCGFLFFWFCFFYFTMEAFTLGYFFQILKKTIVSFVFSMILILVYMVIINPKQ